MRTKIDDRRGQILPIAIMLLLVMAIFVPLMVTYTQSEAKWSVKQSETTTAFHMAEAGIEKGYLQVSLSSTGWQNLQNGTPMTGYNFDQQYTDLVGAGGVSGSYAISITSGPNQGQATIITVGRDPKRRETRSIKAIYSNNPMGGTAIYAGGGTQIGGGVQVEWGAIISPNAIDSAGRLSPQFWSASSIAPYKTSPNPPLCDSPNCCQWHAYQKNIPPAPPIDLSAYAALAAADTTDCVGMTGANPAGSCYFPGNQSTGGNNWNNPLGTLANPATVYVNGDLTVTSSNKLNVVGSLIVIGNLNLPNGVWGNGSYALEMPQDAWKQYCRNWGHYTPWDGGAPAGFPGLTASYKSAAGLTPVSPSKVAVYGMFYVGGNLNSAGGGGNADIYGAMYSVGTTSMTSASGVTFYYNAGASASLQTTGIVLTRTYWEDTMMSWPSTAGP